MKPKVYVRVDGNPKIGLGHLVRCIALAHMLKNDFDITFVCKEIPSKIQEEITKENFKLQKIKEEREFLNEVSSKDIAILDGYHFETNYQKQLKTKGTKLICIDDLHDKEFYADLIINHAPGKRPQDYKAQPYTEFALGPKYALLRPSFLQQAKQNRKISKINSVLICFGGSDFKNLTRDTLDVVLKFSDFKKVIVITGDAYNYQGTLDPLIKSDSRVEYYKAVNEGKMLSLMLRTQLIIAPSSGILYEASVTNSILITTHYASNQTKFHDFLVQNYGVLSFGESSASLNQEMLHKTIQEAFKARSQNFLSEEIAESRNNIISKISKVYYHEV